MDKDEDYKVTFSFYFFDFEKNTYIFLTKFPRIILEILLISPHDAIERLNLTRGIRHFTVAKRQRPKTDFTIYTSKDQRPKAKGQRLNWFQDFVRLGVKVVFSSFHNRSFYFYFFGSGGWGYL